MKELRSFLVRLEGGKLAPLVQFVKFGLVGVSNTVIAYSIEMLCYYVLFARFSWPDGIRIFVVSALAFIVSTANSYYWNSRYVFATGKVTLRTHMILYARMAACYAITGLVLVPVIKMYASGKGIPYWIVSMGALIITVPLNFVLNKAWAFRKKDRHAN